MTRIVALLCFYDEHPDFLRDVITSLPPAGVDHLVAYDGAYALYPDARPESHPAQHAAIVQAADTARIPLTLHTPEKHWESECEKRTAMFAEADEHNPDWYLVIDADEVILQAPVDLKDRLAATERDYGDVLSLEHFAPTMYAAAEDDEPIILAQRYVKPRRCLIRAVPGIVVGPAHFDYVTPDGRNLWGDEYGTPLLVRDMVIDHRNRLRAPDRMSAAIEYRDARDASGIERVLA